MRFVAYMIVGPGEGDRWLEPVMRQLHWCDQVAVCLNNADEKTAKIARKYAHVVEADDRVWGENQWRIKQDFLAKVVAKNPADDLWFIGLDADEILDKRFDRAMAEKMASGKDIAWYFWCLQLYNDERTVRPDLCFPNIRFWKYLPDLGLDFQPTPLHCGLAPRYSYRFGSQSGLWFKHYGLMLAADRARKVARYDKYDPKAKFKGKSWYDALRNERARGVPFEDMVARLPNFIYRANSPKLGMSKRADKITFFRNKHGKVVEAVGEQQHTQFKAKGFVELPNMRIDGGVEAPVVPAAAPAAATAPTACEHEFEKSLTSLEIVCRKCGERRAEDLPLPADLEAAKDIKVEAPKKRARKPKAAAAV